MSTVDRRGFLQLTGLVTGGVLLGGCNTAPSQEAREQAGTLRWWDQFQPISSFEKKLFAAFAKEDGGMPVEYEVQNPENQGKALQLAWQSKQLPDVFTLVGVELPPARLEKQGWFSPIELDGEHEKLLPDSSRVEGKNVFDGKLYAMPIFSFRSHDTLNWFNKDLYAKADLDPDDPPTTYDDIRAGARAIQKAGGDGISGWIAPLKMVLRLEMQILQMAAAAGAPISGGVPPDGGIDLRTGEYAYHTQPFVDAIEFWIAMKRDKVLFPASTSLDARTARARWATGIAGTFFDGSYNIGVLNAEFKQFAGKVGVGSIPVPDDRQQVALCGVPANAALSFWISGKSKHVDAASALIAKFIEDDGQRGLAEAMDQPPLNSKVLADADVHPTYERSVELFNEQVFNGPSLSVRNPKTIEVASAMNPVQPTLGEIVQGAVTGELADWQGALKKLSDKLTAERDKTIKSVGSGVGVDDWRFADWKRGSDYVTKPGS
ncbi:MAG: extracellular solute-binding protein [Streptosporangiales bacterium]|nr:extracellular solute-binding protein [Streptosporangiales bacterium]